MNFKGCSIVTKMIKGFSSPPEVKYTNLSWLMLLDFWSLFFNVFFALFFLHPNCHIQALQSQCFLRKFEGPDKFKLVDSVGLTHDVSFELNFFDRFKLGWYVIFVTSSPSKV